MSQWLTSAREALLRASTEWSRFADDLDIRGSARAFALLLTIALLGFAVTLALSFCRRILAGSGIRALLSRGCAEWVPARGLLVVVSGSLLLARWGALAALFCMCQRLFVCVRHGEPGAWVDPAAWSVVGLTTFVLLRRIERGFRARFIDVSPSPPPAVNIAVSAIDAGGDASAMARIGTERFPNSTAPGFRFGLLVRKGLATVLLTLLLGHLVIAVDSRWLAESELSALHTVVPYLEQAQASYRSMVLSVRDLPYVQPIAWVIAYFALVLLLIVVGHNRHYLVIRFATSQVLSLLLAIATWVGIAGIGPCFDQDLALPTGTAIVLLWILVRRLRADLRLASRHVAVRHLLRPIMERLDALTHKFLGAVQADAACRLPELSRSDLSSRITRGARNLEEGDRLVTRCFGRYMRVAKVNVHKSTTASLRFLTVDRSTVLGNFWPSHAAFREPVVPIWDQARFPLRPPEGFAARRDVEVLSSAWNPVRYCPPTEQRTETYYDTEHYSEYDSQSQSTVMRVRQVTRTRQVTVTCSRCQGAGRLEFQVNLVTNWAVARPTVVSPQMSMSELVEHAEETLYYQLPIVEAGEYLPPGPRSVEAGAQLVEQMNRAGASLLGETEPLARAIIQCVGGAWVYRCDFIIGGFNALRIRFSHLSSRGGWFFGKRPEFHFPSLPLGWASVGTWLFLPPIALTLWLAEAILLFLACSFIVRGALPSISTALQMWLQRVTS